MGGGSGYGLSPLHSHGPLLLRIERASVDEEEGSSSSSSRY